MTESEQYTEFGRERYLEQLPDFIRNYGLLIPGLVFMGIFFLIPLVLIFIFTFYINPQGIALYRPGFTLNHYIRFLNSTFYQQKVILTLKYGAAVTAMDMLLGYPLAYFIARTTPWKRRILILSLLSVLYVTYVIRAYSWTVILTTNGLVYNLMQALGLDPIVLYPGPWSVVIGLTYSLYPLFVLTLYSSMSNIPRELEEASMNLGASRLKTFYNIVLPLSKNGAMAGAMIVFVLTIGSFIHPTILGSPSEYFISVYIEQLAVVQFNVPFASVLSLVLLVIVLAIIAVISHFIDFREVT